MLLVEGLQEIKCTHVLTLRVMFDKNDRRLLFGAELLCETPTKQVKNQNGVTYAEVLGHQAEIKLFI